jgi:hypothetical protein
MMQRRQDQLINRSRLETGLLVAHLLITRHYEFFDRLAKRTDDRLAYDSAAFATYESARSGTVLSGLRPKWTQSIGVPEKSAAHNAVCQPGDRSAAFLGGRVR